MPKIAKKPKTLAYYCEELSDNKHERTLTLQHLNSVFFSFTSMDKKMPLILCVEVEICIRKFTELIVKH